MTSKYCVFGNILYIVFNLDYSEILSFGKELL